MSELIRVTVACPEDLRADANQLAMALGLGPGDAATYGVAGYEDAEGYAYAVASFTASAHWVAGAKGQLVRPVWDADALIDMEAANRAQQALHVWTFVEGEEPPKAEPGRITAIIGMEGRAAVAAMGLEQVEKESAE